MQPLKRAREQKSDASEPVQKKNKQEETKNPLCDVCHDPLPGGQSHDPFWKVYYPDRQGKAAALCSRDCEWELVKHGLPATADFDAMRQPGGLLDPSKTCFDQFYCGATKDPAGAGPHNELKRFCDVPPDDCGTDHPYLYPGEGKAGAVTVHLEYRVLDRDYTKRLALRHFAAVRDVLLACMPPLLPVMPLHALVISYVEAECVVQPFSAFLCTTWCLNSFRWRFEARLTPYVGLPFLVPSEIGPFLASPVFSAEEQRILEQHMCRETSLDSDDDRVSEDSEDDGVSEDSEDDAEGDEL
jgi:hypothetical protein